MSDVEKLYLSPKEKLVLYYIKFRKKIFVKDIHKKPITKKLLRERRLIEVVYNNRHEPTNKLVLSEYGRNYIAYRSERRFENIYTPIIVTILTNIVIYGIKLLLSLIQGLL